MDATLIEFLKYALHKISVYDSKKNFNYEDNL